MRARASSAASPESIASCAQARSDACTALARAEHERRALQAHQRLAEERAVAGAASEVARSSAAATAATASRDLRWTIAAALQRASSPRTASIAWPGGAPASRG
jgi:hypothetical protein